MILIAFALTSCGKFVKPKKKKDVPAAELLAAKQDLYVNNIATHQDEYGFILTDECDSLIFSGLLSAARPDLNINIAKAEDVSDSGNVQWFRRPNHDCGPAFDNSRSTISRDMIVGLMWHMWRNKDVDMAVRLMKDLRSRTYYLRGEGTVGELLMTPAMMQTLAEMIFRMGGPTYDVERALPAIFSVTESGFVAHLTTLHILLRAEIYGGIFASDRAILKAYYEREPKNPLFSAAVHKYTDGDMSEPVGLLMDNGEWPNDRLPTTSNHCDNWPIQRTYDEKNWGACSPLKEHTGAELVVIYNLIIK